MESCQFVYVAIESSSFTAVSPWHPKHEILNIRAFQEGVGYYEGWSGPVRESLPEERSGQEAPAAKVVKDSTRSLLDEFLGWLVPGRGRYYFIGLINASTEAVIWRRSIEELFTKDEDRRVFALDKIRFLDLRCYLRTDEKLGKLKAVNLSALVAHFFPNTDDRTWMHPGPRRLTMKRDIHERLQQQLAAGGGGRGGITSLSHLPGASDPLSQMRHLGPGRLPKLVEAMNECFDLMIDQLSDDPEAAKWLLCKTNANLATVAHLIMYATAAVKVKLALAGSAPCYWYYSAAERKMIEIDVSDEKNRWYGIFTELESLFRFRLDIFKDLTILELLAQATGIPELTILYDLPALEGSGADGGRGDVFPFLRGTPMVYQPLEGIDDSMALDLIRAGIPSFNFLYGDLKHVRPNEIWVYMRNLKGRFLATAENQFAVKFPSSMEDNELGKAIRIFEDAARF